MTGGSRLSLRKHFRKPMADDAGDFSHEIRHFSPFVRQQVMLQLGVNRPLGIYLDPIPADEDADQLDFPRGLIGSVFA